MTDSELLVAYLQRQASARAKAFEHIQVAQRPQEQDEESAIRRIHLTRPVDESST
jgi:formiminotetrahydrofolate cyclodeaminase